MENVYKKKFWDRTGFVTNKFEEAILWISILNDRRITFAMTPRIIDKDEIWYVFVTNANTYVAEDLIKTEEFHGEFPVFNVGSIFA